MRVHARSGSSVSRPEKGDSFAVTADVREARLRSLGSLLAPRRGRAGSVEPTRQLGATAKAALLAGIDATLERTATHLRSLQQVDGRWDTAFTAGSFHLAFSSLALALLGSAEALAQGRAVLETFARDQRGDGGFAITPAGGTSPSATRLVVLALERMIARDPALAEPARPLLARARGYLERGEPEDKGLYGLAVDILAGLFGRPEDASFSVDTDLALRIATAWLNGTLSNLAAKATPSVMLLLLHRKDLGSTARLLLATLGITEAQLEKAIVDSQDGDGGWGWTDFATTLALLALHLNGRRAGESQAVAAGVQFLEDLRRTDLSAWTHGDAWDSGLVALTLSALGGAENRAAAARGVEAVLAGRLADGRLSFNIEGQLGDNDTTSTGLRAMCAAYADAAGDTDRAKLAEAIDAATLGLCHYQQASGGWGAFNKDAAQSRPWRRQPIDATDSALNDMASPDLTGRVVRSLLAARDSGALSEKTARRVERALRRGHDFFVGSAHEEVGSWWSRWIAGADSAFAFVVPALRRFGLAADDALFAKTRTHLLYRQNKDGGWGQDIDADRDGNGEVRRGKSSSVAHTVSAIIGLIGTARDRDAKDSQLNLALERGVAYLLRAERDGSFSNGKPLYTVLTGLDYYDADTSTTCFVAAALALYRDFLRVGPEKAVARCLL